MEYKYALPVTAWLTATDGTRIAVIPDGRRMTMDEWKTTRVTPEEYSTLVRIKRSTDTREWDPNLETFVDTYVQEEPDYI